MKHCIVIGGGIIGLCTAYYLHKEGFKVTVLDKSGMNAGASYVNAGYITPSHIIPLAAPGVMAKGIKWMFNSSSPFYMKPKVNKDFLKWIWYFNRAATAGNVQKAIPVIKEINLLSRELFQEIYDSHDLGDFHWERKGLLMLYKTDRAGTEEERVAARAIKEGLEVKALSKKELLELEPAINDEVKGAFHYICDAHTTPTQFMERLVAYLKKNDVVIRSHEEVRNLSWKSGKIDKIYTTKNVYTPEEVIIASGSWSMEMAKKIGLKLPLEAGKGYRINVNRPTMINYPAILMEAKVAVTPMKGFTRFAGTMELSGINHRIRKERVLAIAKASESYYRELHIAEEEIAKATCGLRPVSPDGLPYIGRAHKYSNVTFATGHAMMGWSLGPVTGKLVSEIVADKKLSMNIDPFHPNRKF